MSNIPPNCVLFYSWAFCFQSRRQPAVAATTSWNQGMSLKFRQTWRNWSLSFYSWRFKERLTVLMVTGNVWWRPWGGLAILRYFVWLRRELICYTLSSVISVRSEIIFFYSAQMSRYWTNFERQYQRCTNISKYKISICLHNQCRLIIYF